jgi:peptidoglycan/xylan/chitin deacetylase (PgdA/CDA1 family)
MRVITQAATTLLILALAVFTVQKAVGPAPPQPTAGTKFDRPTPPAQAPPNSDQGTIASAARPSSFMTPWPDLEDLTTSVSTAGPVASGPAEPASSAPSPVASEKASQSNAHSALMGVTTTDVSEASSARSDIATCEKPDAMRVSRVVEIDTTGGPEFGLQHLKGYEFLRDREVVLTFDDGPRPVSTLAVLKALQDECLKATFFEIGQPASWHPEITKQVIDAGMTVGTHTWSHKDLARGLYAKDVEKAAREIEMGNSAVHMAAAGAPVAPFFRFPDLQHSPRSLEYLAHRNIAVFSTDVDSRDFTMHKPEQVIVSVMSQLEKRGKGVVLLHDFHRNTAEALPELLGQLKLAGYKVVHMVPKVQLTTISKYDEMFDHRENLSSSAEPGSAAAPGHVAATHHRRSMFMYVPTPGSTMYPH